MTNQWKYKDHKKLQKKIDEYFNKCDNEPFIKNDVVKVGSNAGQLLPIPIQQPYTMQGLCYHLDITEQTYYNWLSVENNPELFEIITRADNKIKSQQIAGAAAGVFNPLIVARLNKLKESQDITTNGENINTKVTCECGETRAIRWSDMLGNSDKLLIVGICDYCGDDDAFINDVLEIL